MKKIYSNINRMRTTGFLIAVSTLVSCKKLVDVPADPTSQITREHQFTDSASTLAAVVGVYSYTSSGGIPYSDGNFDLHTALSAHEVSFNGGYGDQGEFYSFSLTPLNSSIAALWSAPYAALYQVNDVLAGISNNGGLSARFVKQITGEMELTRAFYYFYLVNIFGGIPVITSTDYNTTAQLPRAADTTVYTQILTDLNDARNKLTADYPVESSGHVRPNVYTALALLSKVHLFRGQWQAAYDEADSVIEQGGFSLEADPNNVFLDGSQEAIWQLPVLNAYRGTADATNYMPYSAAAAPSFPVTETLLAQFEPGDLRFTAWLGVNVVNGQNLYYPYKYKDFYPTSPATDFMMIRLAEVYLIRAEAAAQLNKLDDALADANIIRARAGLGAADADVASRDAVLAVIAKERQTELCFEFGNRWLDLVRTGKAASELPGYQANDALYPVPQQQLKLNSHLVQNPGYH